MCWNFMENLWQYICALCTKPAEWERIKREKFPRYKTFYVLLVLIVIFIFLVYYFRGTYEGEMLKLPFIILIPAALLVILHWMKQDAINRLRSYPAEYLPPRGGWEGFEQQQQQQQVEDEEEQQVDEEDQQVDEEDQQVDEEEQQVEEEEEEQQVEEEHVEEEEEVMGEVKKFEVHYGINLNQPMDVIEDELERIPDLRPLVPGELPAFLPPLLDPSSIRGIHGKIEPTRPVLSQPQHFTSVPSSSRGKQREFQMESSRLICPQNAPIPSYGSQNVRENIGEANIGVPSSSRRSVPPRVTLIPDHAVPSSSHQTGMSGESDRATRSQHVPVPSYGSQDLSESNLRGSSANADAPNSHRRGTHQGVLGELDSAARSQQSLSQAYGAQKSSSQPSILGQRDTSVTIYESREQLRRKQSIGAPRSFSVVDFGTSRGQSMDTSPLFCKVSDSASTNRWKSIDERLFSQVRSDSSTSTGQSKDVPRSFFQVTGSVTKRRHSLHEPQTFSQVFGSIKSRRHSLYEPLSFPHVRDGESTSRQQFPSTVEGMQERAGTSAEESAELQHASPKIESETTSDVLKAKLAISLESNLSTPKTLKILEDPVKIKETSSEDSNSHSD